MFYHKILRLIIFSLFFITVFYPWAVLADSTQVTVTIIPAADSPSDSPSPTSPVSSGGWAPHGPQIIFPEFKAPEFVFEPAVLDPDLDEPFKVTSTATATTTVKKKAARLAVSLLPVKIIYDAHNPRMVYMIFATDMPTSALVEYGRTRLDESRQIKDTVLQNNHKISLDEIEPGEIYYFYIIVYSQAGNWTSLAGGFQTYYETDGGYYIDTLDSEELKSRSLDPISRKLRLESPAAYILVPSLPSPDSSGVVAKITNKSFIRMFFEWLLALFSKTFYQFMAYIPELWWQS